MALDMAQVTAILPQQRLCHWVLDHPVLLGIFWLGNCCQGRMRGDAGACWGAAQDAEGHPCMLFKSALGRKVVRKLIQPWDQG